jgi:hypothetical protein
MPSDPDRIAHCRFYVPPPWPEPGEVVALSEEEGRHAMRVLRLRPGAMIGIVDGNGISALAQVIETGKGTLRALGLDHRKGHRTGGLRFPHLRCRSVGETACSESRRPV